MSAFRKMSTRASVMLAVCTAACSDSPAPAAPDSDTMAAIAKQTIATMPSAEIAFETQVPGYSQSGNAGWIRVVPGGGGSGRVMNAGTPKAYTDRVARGEPIRVSINARGVSQSRVIGVAGIVASNGFAQGASVSVPYIAQFRVSNDVTFDNAYVQVLLLDQNLQPIGGPTELRVPIGKRP